MEPNTIHSSYIRSLIKAMSYRIVCTTETFLITLLVLGEWKIAGGLTVALGLVKVLTYFGHERLWDKITWGRG